MYGMILAALAGAVVGGVTKGVTAGVTNARKTADYRKAAEQVKTAADKYSGTNEYNRQLENARRYADAGQAVAEQAGANYVSPTGPGVTGAGVASSAYAGANEAGQAAADATRNAMASGKSAQGTLDQAQYNNETAEAQRAMKQADINYNVANQAANEGLGALGGVADLVKNIGA